MLNDNKNYGPKIDVYSMGVSFYEMVHLETPRQFQYGKTLFNEDKKKNYSKELLDIINLMLEKDQNKRKITKEIYFMIEEIYKKNLLKFHVLKQ